MHSLDTLEYYLEPNTLGEVYELYVVTHDGSTPLKVASRSSFKQIEAIHDYVLERGCVTISSVEDDRRILRTYRHVDQLEIRFPE